MQDSTLRNMLNTIPLCKPGFTKFHRSLDNIVSLAETELRTRSRKTLGEIVRLHNSAVADKGSIDEYYRDLVKSGQSWDNENRVRL